MGQHQLDTLAVNTIRFLAADAVQRANSGHPGLPMGAAPAAYVLWTRHLKRAPSSPRYREEILPPDLGPRLAVEAGVALGWYRWIAPRGAVLALDRFGASAPGDRVMTKLGFTPDHVAERAVRLLA